MSDDHNTPQTSQPQEQLEYWHSTDPVPLHPALLTLCTIAGIILGAGMVLVVGFFIGLGSFSLEGSNPHKHVILVIGITIDLATLGIFYALIRKIRRGRTLAFEIRRRGLRFFAIGLLLGCGLACLAEGICFTGVGVNS